MASEGLERCLRSTVVCLKRGNLTMTGVQAAMLRGV